MKFIYFRIIVPYSKDWKLYTITRVFYTSKYLSKNLHIITWHKMKAFWKISNIGIVYAEMCDDASQKSRIGQRLVSGGLRSRLRHHSKRLGLVSFSRTDVLVLRVYVSSPSPVYTLKRLPLPINLCQFRRQPFRLSGSSQQLPNAV